MLYVAYADLSVKKMVLQLKSKSTLFAGSSSYTTPPLGTIVYICTLYELHILLLVVTVRIIQSNMKDLVDF